MTEQAIITHITPDGQTVVTKSASGRQQTVVTCSGQGKHVISADIIANLLPGEMATLSYGRSEAVAAPQLLVRETADGYKGDLFTQVVNGYPNQNLPVTVLWRANGTNYALRRVEGEPQEGEYRIDGVGDASDGDPRKLSAFVTVRPPAELNGAGEPYGYVVATVEPVVVLGPK